MQLLIRIFSFFCNSKKPPKTSQKVLQTSFSYLGYIYELNLPPNCFEEDIALRCSDQFYQDRNKLPICRPFHSDYVKGTSP